ncbi:MAG: hypothetical protein IPN19_02785 [Elusimicrobia bacterium]|nr:hypothetical protein [Elusimicrobiota bacterium]
MLTVKVRGLGLETQFVPSCVAVSHEGSTLGQTIEFTNRQSLISRSFPAVVVGRGDWAFVAWRWFRSNG